MVTAVKILYHKIIHPASCFLHQKICKTRCHITIKRLEKSYSIEPKMYFPITIQFLR